MNDGYIVAGKRIYVVCDKCGALVQVNKFLFGSLHICVGEVSDDKKTAQKGH